MPMPVDARVVRRSGVIEVHRANVSRTDRPFDDLHRCRQSLFFADVVPGSKSVRRVEADSESQLVTTVHQVPQVSKRYH